MGEGTRPFSTNRFSFTDISDKQYAMMCHAIGFGDKEFKSKKKSFFPCRNYYDAGEADICDWLDLAEKGLAISSVANHRMFYLTRAGYAAITWEAEKQIWSKEASSKADTRYAVLMEFCKQANAICYGCWLPISAAHLANSLLIPVKKVREACRQLVSDGYLVKGYDGGQDDEGMPYCAHGYYATDKLRRTEMWKESNRKAIEEIEGMLNQQGG